MTVTSLPLLSRIWLSWLTTFRILFDGRFAAQVLALRAGQVSDDSSAPPALPITPADSARAHSRPPAADAALQLLALLQREGRFLDFVQQDVAAFPDAEIGAAARVVHEGCRRAIRAHARVVSVRTEAEGAPLTLERASEDVKLVGNVAGSAPFRGVLRHRGWRVEELKLPTMVGEHDLTLVAPAELELS
ncbi:MAG TPA: DUF2760 domain-containing protein [Polyangiaceae bacterium]|nr:DUF2760 domain-containing protein [Polyangiaceae bacterium]